MSKVAFTLNNRIYYDDLTYKTTPELDPTLETPNHNKTTYENLASKPSLIWNPPYMRVVMVDIVVILVSLQ